MASTKEYLDFVMEQLSGLDEVSSRAMMGAYILYYRGRIFGGIYDDRLLVKPVPMALRLMDCFWCNVTEGEITLKEAEDARWLSKDELYSVDWLPADMKLIEKLEFQVCRLLLDKIL